MKILKIKFKNLNSLQKEWEIDFTNPVFSSGIFAITGPTGSGKTTILDSVCLALYGRTPRESVQKSGNEVMSKGCGECYSEVEFESSGKIYKSRFEQSRARKKPEGALQNVFLKLYEIKEDGLEELCFEEKSSAKYELAIAGKIGVTFSQFTKSVMLAQGAFADFLKADRNGRTEILEKITKTDFYRKLSVKIYKKTEEEKKKYGDILTEKNNLRLLTTEEENGLVQEKNAKESYALELNRLLKRLRKAEDLLNRRDFLEKDLASYLVKIEEAGLRKKKFSEELEKLKLRQIEFERVYDRISEKLRLASEKEAVIKEKELSLKNYESDYEVALTEKAVAAGKIEKNVSAFEELKKRSAVLEDALQNTERDQDLIENFSALDLKGREIIKDSELADLKGIEISDLEKRLSVLRRASSELLEHEGENRKNLSVAKAAREELSSLSAREISDSLDACKDKLERIKSLLALLKERTEIEAEIRLTSDNEANRKSELDLCLRSVSKFELEKNGRYLRKKELEIELRTIAKILSFSNERKALKDDVPCPLCGSVYHPYALGNIPFASDAENELGALEKSISDIESELETLKIRKASLGAEIKINRDSLEKLQKKKTELDEMIKSVSSEYDMDCYDPKALEAAEKALEIEAKKTERLYRDACFCDENIKSFLFSIESDSARLASVKEEVLKTEALFLENSKTLRRLQEKISVSIESFKLEASLYGIDNLDVRRLEKVLDILKARKLKRLKLQEEYRNASLAIGDLEQKSNILKDKLLRLEESEKKALSGRNSCLNAIEELKSSMFALFEDVPGYAGSVSLEQKRIEGLRNKLNESVLDCSLGFSSASSELDSAESKKVELSESLNFLKSEMEFDFSREEIEEKIRESESSLETISQEIGRLRHTLDLNNADKRSSLLISERLEKQAEVLRPWEKLSKLLGSEKGDKYQRFAQRVTLSALLKQANAFLLKMDGRYRLTLGADFFDEAAFDKSPLFVIDAEQGGEIRPVSNLSGGETFMASLALALGLSAISSNDIKIDSLFIDEGFATLDENALSKALQLLSSLAKSGRTIGLISHVEALKESVSARIEVTKVSEGRSLISGAGVRSLGGSKPEKKK